MGNSIAIIFFVVAIYVFGSIINVLLQLFKLKKADELQKRTLLDTLAVSMVIVLAINFFQLIVFSGNVEPLISSDVNTSNNGNHLDSFMMECIIISTAYGFNRLKYGLISKKRFIVTTGIPLAAIIVLVLMMLYFSIK